MKNKLFIDPDIRVAQTINKEFYMTDKYFRKSGKAIFQKNWSFAGDTSALKFAGDTLAISLFPGFLDIPLLLIRNEDRSIQCLSNVCTHRGNLLIDHPGNYKKIVCKYHGRRFDLSGKMEFMPEFSDVDGFPNTCDHLSTLNLIQWQNLLLVNMDSEADHASTIANLDRYIGFEPVNQYIYSDLHSKTYTVKAHWAMYCENYLEGFHIPFVHKQLNEMLDYGKYEVRCFDKIILQIAYSADPGICFKLPDDHPLQGEQISAFYFYLFPNIMLNFYPWGLSVNIVEPIRKNLSRIVFKTYIKDQNAYENAHISKFIDKVEREDEAIVEKVQIGIQSPLYQRGRYSPKRETGVHHFHCLIADAFHKNRS